MKIMEWEAEIAGLSEVELRSINGAFNVLLGWGSFKEEYKEYGLGTIQIMIQNQLKEWAKDLSV